MAKGAWGDRAARMLILHIFAPCHSWRGRREAERKTTAWLLVRLYGCTGASGRIVHLLRVRRPATRGHQWPLARNERWQKVAWGNRAARMLILHIFAPCHSWRGTKKIFVRQQARPGTSSKEPPDGHRSKRHTRQSVGWCLIVRQAGQTTSSGTFRT